jgi:nucleotide-binding universal stress UspA family protein
MALVIFGVLVSIPIIVWGSQLVIKLMDRFPAIITLGGMLLGWIAGTMTVTDPALVNPDVLPQMPKLVASDAMRYGAGIAGALLVLAIGRFLTARHARQAVPAAVAAAPAVAGRLRSILLAVDGSEWSQKAAQQVLAMRGELRDPAGIKLHLVNVQRPVSGDVSSFVAKQSLQEYYDEGSEAALQPARSLLQAAGAVFKEHRGVGAPGAVIAELARSEGCDLIVMGSRGLGANTAALIGSVAQATLEHASVPVLLVK